jgi:hypothetical protein
VGAGAGAGEGGRGEGGDVFNVSLAQVARLASSDESARENPVETIESRSGCDLVVAVASPPCGPRVVAATIT